MAVLRWLKTVFKQWVADVTGGVLIGAMALYSELSGVTVPPRIYEVVIVFVLFQAMFLAWQEQEQRALKSEAKLMTLRQSAQFGLGLVRLSLMVDPPYERATIQLEMALRNNLPNNALRYMVESEVLVVGGQTLEGSGLSTNWHRFGPLTEQSFLGQRFQNVSFAGPRMEGTVEYCILYGIAGDSVSYRMARKMELIFTNQLAPGSVPVLQRWVVLFESDTLVP